MYQTEIRTMLREHIHPEIRTFTLPAREAVVMAYIGDVYGAGELVPASDLHEKHHADAWARVEESRTRPGVYHIILAERAWFGFPKST